MEQKKDISKELDGHVATLLILSPENHTSSLMKMMGSISKKKICFVTLGRTYSAVAEDMKKAGVSAENLFILDAVTSTFSSNEKPPEHVTFIPSPDALTELNIAIIETIKKEKCEYLIFDSLSTLLTYREGPLVARFADFVIGKVREFKSRVVFTCLANDSKSQAIREISIHMDNVAHFEGEDKN